MSSLSCDPGISEDLVNYHVCCCCLFCLAFHLFQVFLTGQAPLKSLPPLPVPHTSYLKRVQGSFGGAKLGDCLWISIPGFKPFSIYRNSFYLDPEIPFLFQSILEPIKIYLAPGEKEAKFLLFSKKLLPS